ncbi:Spb1 C-terminal domain-containing protein [Globomyces pollinis-pini]|nr:Spb1 C-terminal domain-containing protein [Globomyces pollinis-pini]
MGATKKHAKGRLDKYYHMAKEQGYRARSAFKLIQLNKKYAFLEKSKCLIDLCAAPGGWLQVASKYMPKPNLIVGVDLAAIKPIPGCITHVEDITTPSCRITLKRDLKTWKADVVLHDGAPNVGVSWAQDAFTQSELTLSACKLATEFLVPGGTFVTKVFRSKDYNKLMWVFNQLFGKVEATKPASSRNVSAEIFVVCQNFLAPKKIDPRLLDAKFAFKEMDDGVEPEELSLKKIKEQQGAIMNDLFHPEKRKRHRDGYEDGDYTLHTTNDVAEFIKSPDFIGILSRSSALTFTKDDFSQSIQSSSLTTEEIKEYLKDLKVLGKKEFKQIIKWRDSIRVLMDLVPKKVETVEEEPEEELDLDTVIQNERELMETKLKKLKKKRQERKAKVLLKMRLGMDTPMDIGLDAQNDIGLDELNYGDNADDLDDSESAAKIKVQQAPTVKKSIDADAESENEEDSDYLTDDEALENKISRLEADMDTLYDEYERRKIERNPSLKVKKVKAASEAFEEWYGLEADAAMKLPKKSKTTEYDSSDDSSSEEDEGELTIPANKREDETPLSKKAKLFFDNPVFSSLGSEKDDEGFDDDTGLFDDEMVMKRVKKDKKNTKIVNTDLDSDDDDNNKGFEVVPLEKEPDSDDDFAIDTAQAYTMAQKMLTKSGKRDVVDDSFNRYAFNDREDLPSWFTQDENRHNKPTMPVTKEAADIIRARQRALDARPIKKVAEAKFRKQMRTQRRLEKAAMKSATLADQDDVSEKAKLEAASKVMGKAKNKKRSEKEKVKVVVAKGAHKAISGRPRGVKGRYKMVDGPMKKESRATKRIEKKSKKRRR